MTTWRVDSARSSVAVCARSTLHSPTSSGPLYGEVHGDPDALESTAGGVVRIPLKEQTFGDRLRDLAMHRHIDTKRWPEARFEVESATVLERDPWHVRIAGTLDYRDRRTPLEVEARGSLTDDALDALARFELSLSALGVTPPKLLFLKVADSVDVTVKLVAQHSR